jgi:hypothetical protein
MCQGPLSSDGGFCAHLTVRVPYDVPSLNLLAGDCVVIEMVDGRLEVAVDREEDPSFIAHLLPFADDLEFLSSGIVNLSRHPADSVDENQSRLLPRISISS